jgi:hypothetical protein
MEKVLILIEQDPCRVLTTEKMLPNPQPARRALQNLPWNIPFTVYPLPNRPARRSVNPESFSQSQPNSSFTSVPFSSLSISHFHNHSSPTIPHLSPQTHLTLPTARIPPNI